ncbi:MAG: hypothetical protein ACXWLH_04135 [Candidatus Saccharimonadales bacterium]
MSRSFSQKFWEDKNGKVVVWQAPNRWLLIWLITLVLGWFMPYGWPQKAVGWISLIALVIWAFFEAKSGVNYFRRTIGILVLLLLIIVRFRWLP